MRLDRFLAETTPLSRTLAKRAMKRGEVLVNGKAVAQPATHIDPTADQVSWQGQCLALVGLRYLMLHKPPSVECTARRGRHPRALDLIDVAHPERLHSVGRLDLETTGILLMTDDGQWSHQITSPRKQCPKRYRAVLADPLEGDAAIQAIRAMEEGILLDDDDTPTHPAELVMLSPCHAQLTVYEGRYHQVRRMFAAIGNHVSALHRDAIGNITLDERLAEGQWRSLSAVEIEALGTPTAS